MISSARGGLVALEIYDAFGAPVNIPIVTSAFRELVVRVGVLRERTIHEDLSEGVLMECGHLLSMSHLVSANLGVCVPPVQKIMRAQLSVTTSWLEATQSG
ncbi:hypothetical protein [Frondihabitans sp. VKM Ac-2883]|uniref:hypothetical protein n=1 Tax=Frondihabitans sp. VKM Ac-2883 TaxID=2783823 RepID=UPI001889F7BA|nr:hypothetical protein [Frondihabitans sp. VKM Ac-2883]MBF4577921.1 hypothetical protein [Frondihabitans sp. VKM Ac-2883]